MEEEQESKKRAGRNLDTQTAEMNEQIQQITHCMKQQNFFV